MGTIMDTVVQFMTDNDLHFEALDDRDAIVSNIQGENANYRVALDVHEEKDQLLVYTIGQSNVPEPKRHDVAIFLTRANYGLYIGNFELDMGDGEVRYKVATDVEGSAVSPTMVGNSISYGIRTFDRYFPGLMAVAFGGASPEDGIIQVEQPDTE